MRLVLAQFGDAQAYSHDEVGKPKHCEAAGNTPDPNQNPSTANPRRMARARCVSRVPGWVPYSNMLGYKPIRRYSEFKYAIRSPICWAVKRGHSRLRRSMLSSMRGPCSHSTESMVMSE